MKKFTKGCLLTALILFVVGCLICLVSGLLGGFKQLETVSINGIPFRYRVHLGGVEFGFFDDAWEEDGKSYEDWERIDSKTSGTKTKLDIDVNELRNLELSMGACSFTIAESEDTDAWISLSGNTANIYYSAKGDTFEMESRQKNGWISWGRNGIRNDASVVLYLPRGMSFDTIDIAFGAGSIEASALRAKSVEVEMGAGEGVFAGIDADNVTLTVGAGSMTVENLKAREADVETGVGRIVVDNMEIMNYMNLQCDMGSAELGGTIAGNLDAECGMGSLTMQLSGSEEDHDYNIECGMGEVHIGRTSYTGLANEKYIRNDSDSEFDIECSMGSVTIQFGY